MLLRIWMGLLWDDGMCSKTLAGIRGGQLWFWWHVNANLQLKEGCYAVQNISNRFIRAVVLKIYFKSLVI